jgi:hypothetical protein
MNQTHTLIVDEGLVTYDSPPIIGHVGNSAEYGQLNVKFYFRGRQWDQPVWIIYDYFTYDSSPKMRPHMYLGEAQTYFSWRDLTTDEEGDFSPQENCAIECWFKYGCHDIVLPSNDDMRYTVFIWDPDIWKDGKCAAFDIWYDEHKESPALIPYLITTINE